MRILPLLVILALPLRAQTSAPRPDTTTRRDTPRTLEAVKVTATRAEPPKVAAIQRLTLPAIASVTSAQAQQTVNLVDPEDAVKYLPSVFLRKRNYGDTQATMATRVWGVSSSARSLVFADGVPLTALVANNNTIGGPRWGLVSPEEISRIDMMYGPFSAAYAGNSMGAVMEITTRQPDSLTGSLQQTGAIQKFSLYGTQRAFGTSQTNGTIGDRFGRFSFWASGNYLDSHSQPLLYVTSPTFPPGTTGGYPEQNKLGGAANVLGASGLLHTQMTNAKMKVGYDFTPALRAAYTFGFWQNDVASGVDTYVQRSGQPTLASQTGFATGTYDLLQRHSAHSLAVRSDTKGDWDVEAVGSLYRMDRDQQRFPTGTTAADTFSTAGRVARLDGTGWQTLDLKGAWHHGGVDAVHAITFGVHEDRYNLQNPTYNTPEWRAGNVTTVATEGDGRTRTRALWAQDSWRLAPTLRLTVGGRYEWWRAYDGFNASGTTTVTQDAVTANRFSPKAILAWTPSLDWSVTGSAGKAYRFATPAELYQLVSTGATFTSPDPHLKPDNDLSAELRTMRRFEHGSVQVALFQDDIHDAIISQFLPIVQGSSTPYSVVSNVDHVRARGVELTLGEHEIVVPKLELSGSATYLDARTLALSGSASATTPAGGAVGKFLPNIPQWRATVQAGYHATEPLLLSLSGRYSGKLYTTLDNADVNPNTYQGFGEWFVMDARANYQVDRHWAAAIGVDNLLGRKYFLFHPFPQRTLVASAKYAI